MYIVATFEHDITLELALNDIELKGIKRKDILCLPLNKRVQTKKFFDTVHRTDGRNTMGFPYIAACSLSLFGSIYGFKFKWGPIIWAGLGFLAGLAVGFAIQYIIYRLWKRTSRRNSLSEVVVMVHCEKTKEDEVIDTMWEQGALGVAKLYR